MNNNNSNSNGQCWIWRSLFSTSHLVLWIVWKRIYVYHLPSKTACSFPFECWKLLRFTYSEIWTIVVSTVSCFSPHTHIYTFMHVACVAFLSVFFAILCQLHTFQNKLYTSQWACEQALASRTDPTKPRR